MQYKFCGLLLLICCALTVSSPTCATDENDLRREESDEYVCDILKEDCSQQKDVTVVEL